MKFSRVNYAKASSLFYIATRLYPWNKCSRHLTFKPPIKLFLMISDPFCSQSDGLFELNRYVIVSEALTSRNVSWWFETSYPLSKCCSNCGSQGIIHTHRHYIHIPVSIHLFLPFLCCSLLEGKPFAIILFSLHVGNTLGVYLVWKIDI